MSEMHENLSFSVNELIENVRQGDEGAFDILLEKYAPLIGGAVARYGEQLGREDQEDMRQEAVLAFYDAILHYRLDQSTVEFGLYAKICVTNRLITHLRRQEGKDRLVPLDDVLLEALHTGEEESSSGLAEREEWQSLLGLIDRHLSRYESSVFFQYMDGKSSSQIASSLCKDSKSIDNAISRIRKKLKVLLQGRL